MAGAVEEQVAALVEPLIAAKGLELVDVEYVKEGPHWYLRIYVDKEGGVDLDDCAEVSQVVSAELDKADPIKQAYMLEVSSPGLERPLKKDQDFERFKGSLVTVRTTEIYQGFTEFTGYLVGLVGGDVVLEYEGEQMAIPRNLIAKTHLYFEF